MYMFSKYKEIKFTHKEIGVLAARHFYKAHFGYIKFIISTCNEIEEKYMFKLNKITTICFP